MYISTIKVSEYAKELMQMNKNRIKAGPEEVVSLEFIGLGEILISETL